MTSPADSPALPPVSRNEPDFGEWLWRKLRSHGEVFGLGWCRILAKEIEDHWRAALRDGPPGEPGNE